VIIIQRRTMEREERRRETEGKGRQDHFRIVSLKLGDTPDAGLTGVRGLRDICKLMTAGLSGGGDGNASEPTVMTGGARPEDGGVGCVG